MINKTNILEYIQNRGGKSSLEEISELISKEDREKIKQTQEKRFKYEIWDNKTAINGIDAKEIINSRGYAIDKAYLIYVDGNLVYFQDHNPNESGYIKMNKTQAKKIAEEFIKNKIEEYVDSVIVNKVIQTILSK